MAGSSVASELEGALLRSSSLFPYFMLVSLEAGGPLRALLLLFAAPLLCLLELLGLEEASLRVMIFVSTAGLRARDVRGVAKATLPKFFLEDLRDDAYGVFAGCSPGKKFVVTSCPSVMVQPFLREYLDVDCVFGTELRTFKGFFLGLPSAAGVMAASRSRAALIAATADRAEVVDIGFSRKHRDQSLMSLCSKQYWIAAAAVAKPLARSDYPKPLIFHDGRLVSRPTPLNFLSVILWLPFGFFLVMLRILVLSRNLCPARAAAVGIRIRVRAHGSQAVDAAGAAESHSLYVCNHRTLLDPVIISLAVRRKLAAVTYSLSRLSELLSPIPNARLTRDRAKDGAIMRSSLGRRGLVVCPEGTTCREPYLLRFSPLFAELAERVVPVAVTSEGSMFYGTAVRGNKCWDAFFFLVNPSPAYGLEILEEVTAAGKCKYDVANEIQRSIGRAIGFECTNLTRKDKYRMIAGHDG